MCILFWNPSSHVAVEKLFMIKNIICKKSVSNVFALIVSFIPGNREIDPSYECAFMSYFLYFSIYSGL